jgi:alcohol dehydrogenase class IV
MDTYTFRAVNYPARIYSGRGALDNLRDEVGRLRAKRAFIVCGRTVSRRTPLIDSMKANLGDACAGVFDELEKDSPYHSVVAARDAARDAGADLVIAAGGGSVIQAVRVVVILLAEKGDPMSLITQYPAHGPAISVKLMAPKLPIINVCTTATSAANRGGSAVKNLELGHRMEFFDPKTRPASVYWDWDALLTAPESLAVSSSYSVYWRALMNMGGFDANPLVEGDRVAAFRLASRAIRRVADPVDAGPRIELCAAALLQNRDQDDGGAIVVKHWVMRVVYAFATALFNRYGHVSQGAANAAFTPTALRMLGPRDPECLAAMATALGVDTAGLATDAIAEAAAARVEAGSKEIGMPTRLQGLGVPRDGLPQLVQDCLRNFNADPKREFVREQDRLLEVMQAAW